MKENIWFIILWILIGGCVGYLIAKIYFRTHMRKERFQAVNKSRAVVLGQVNEKIAPLLPNFPWHYKDLTFLGKWVDYIVFDWLHQWWIKEIIFLEIKSWTATLNRNERLIQECIQNKRISYQTYKIK